MIRTIWNDEPAEEKPARLGYADYNLFFNPGARSRRTYLLSVSGKTERKDAGFARNDIPRGGRIDEQADPRFKGPIPKAFPFADDDIKARKIGVSKMLAFYREAYTPAAGSPLIGAGDPADGEATNIGAVGSSKRCRTERPSRRRVVRPWTSDCRGGMPGAGIRRSGRPSWVARQRTGRDGQALAAGGDAAGRGVILLPDV
jgi:hypothetical protein